MGVLIVTTDVEKQYENSAGLPVKQVENRGTRPRLTREETAELVQHAQVGDIEARNRLIVGNLGLIIMTIRRMVGSGLQDEFLGDLIFTTINAIGAWRPGCGAAFPSYLAACLRFKLLSLIKCYYQHPAFASLDAPLSTADGDTITLAEALPDPEGQRIQELLADRLDLERVASHLNAEERRIALDYSRGINPHETAAALGVTKQNIAKKQKQIFKKMQKDFFYFRLLEDAAAGRIPDPPHIFETWRAERWKLVEERLRRLRELFGEEEVKKP